MTATVSTPGFSRRRLLIATLLAAGMQTGILVTMMRGNETVISTGTPVLLRTVPVDPRDLFRGDYVVLNYEFSALDSALVTGNWPEAEGEQRLHVELKPGTDGSWHPVSASFGPLMPSDGSVIITSLPFRYVPSPDHPATLRADYGIERYYVPEGKGKELEEARNARRVMVEVRVTPDGEARLVDLTVLPE